MIKEFWEKIRKNHALMMVLCCAIPLIIILALALLGFKSTWLYMLALIACIGMHAAMMFWPSKNEKTRH